MNNCKVCGNEIKHSASIMLEGFCSEKCFWDYEDIFGTNLVEYSETDVIDSKPQVYEGNHFGFECVLKKTGFFIISQKSLDEIYYGIRGKDVVPPKAKEFNDFLTKNGYLLRKLKNSNDSIIQKCSI